MLTTIPIEIEHEELRYHLFATARVGKPEQAYSDERGNFGPWGQEVELVSVLFDEAVITCGPVDELHMTEVDPLPADKWLDYVQRHFDGNKAAWEEFCRSAVERANEDDACAEEAARERWEEDRAERRAERWLAARGLE